MCITQTVLALVALYAGLVHSWDLAVANGELLDFYMNQTKIDTVRFKSQNLGALAYDEVHNMILYVNKQSDNDTICAFNMSTMQYKYLTERNGRNIRGLAFDPATELLFFTDTKERSINSISLKPGSKNSAYGNIVIKMDDGIPTDIAVDSCRGYIYWINTNLTKPTIERARFNGTERQVVINPALVSVNTTFKLEPCSLAIDLQTQKIYWHEPDNGAVYHFYSAYLNGTNKKTNVHYEPNDDDLLNTLNTLSVSRQYLFFVGNCPSCSVWNIAKSAPYKVSKYTSFRQLHKEIPASIVANYKLSDQIQGKTDCQALTGLIQNKSLIDNTFKIAAQYGAEYCVHGMQVDGHSLCKCIPGYIGERCDVSVCENYCINGNCSVNDEGLPKCRCDVGYSGERCQVSACHGYCQNGGDCSLNGINEPVCECKGNFVGTRCEVSDCLNYCIHGNCSVNDGGLPICRCDVGYSGERCQVSACHGYCQNGGDCSLNGINEPVCECKGNFVGTRCEVSDCLNYCIHGNCSVNDGGLPKCRCEVGYSGERCQVRACHGYCQNGGDCSLNGINEPVCECKGNFVGTRCEVSDCLNYCIHGNCSVNDGGLPICRCDVGYSGERCQVSACHGYCQNGGDCSLNRINEPVCECKGNFVGTRCEVSDCLNYCIHGNCSVNDGGLPKCRCDVGYSGERCQVRACHGYCQNGGDCSLNGINEPVCECKGNFVGTRCEVSDCLNYCIHGNCSVNDVGLPKCSCGAGYSGDRCEISACQGYCLNDGECSLNEEDEPICQCVSSHEGSRCEVVKADNFPSTRTSYSAESSLTLADIFSKWRKPISKVTVILESS